MKIPKNLIISYITTNFPHYKIAGDDYHFNSPFNNDKKMRLYVHPESSTWYDQKDQRGGSFDKFIAEYEDINLKDVYFFLIKEYSSRENVEEFIEQEKKIIELKLPNGSNSLNNTNGIIAKQAVAYLEKRKIPKKYINDMYYIFNPSDYEWNKRIIIPFIENEEIVYFIGRAFDDNKLRYNTPKDFDSKQFVFNIDNVKNEVAICEGTFDAMSISNIPATAILSADIGDTQIDKIINKGIDRIIMIPDKDETGDKTLNSNIEKILYRSPPSHKPSILIYNIPEEFKDFNDFMVKTGCDIIEENELKYYNKRKILLNNLMKGFFKG